MELNKYIDHTNLKNTATLKDIEKLCNEAIKYKFASVCIYPYYVPLAKKLLKDTNVEVCTVIGFPTGESTKEVKVYEAIDAVEKGANEIDMVINISALKNKDYDYVKEEIEEVRDAIDGKVLKVIIETCLLTEKEIIYDVGKYIGQSKNELKEGKGIFLYESGQYKDDRYEGFWGNNKREGYGVYTFSNRNRYEGDWKNGKKEGKGIFYFNSGERYEGDFKNGNFEGKGVFYFNSGNRYEGDFKNDKKDGHGIFYYKNGDRRMGDYSNDEPIGKHIILTKIGNVRTEYYEM